MSETYYLCIGHPAWPDPLRIYDYDRAMEWFDEHKHRHPVRVDQVVERRTVIRDAKVLHATEEAP